MDVSKSIESIADAMGGSFTEYSTENLIITVPVKGDRFQAVTTYQLVHDGKKVLELASRVCDADQPDVNYRHLLELNQELTYSKIVIFDGFIQLAAEVVVEHITEDILKDIIAELATTADRIENEITGKDVF
jgi:hypothetical protein